MAWTYDAGLGSNKDRVRFLIGDTSSSDQQLQDTEIEFLIEQNGALNAAAAAACRALAAKYSRFADKWVGDLKILASQKARAYLALAEQLERSAGRSLGYPTAGGITVSDKEVQAEDSSLVQPTFRVGMHDNQSSE